MVVLNIFFPDRDSAPTPSEAFASQFKTALYRIPIAPPRQTYFMAYLQKSVGCKVCFCLSCCSEPTPTDTTRWCLQGYSLKKQQFIALPKRQGGLYFKTATELSVRRMSTNRLSKWFLHPRVFKNLHHGSFVHQSRHPSAKSCSTLHRVTSQPPTSIGHSVDLQPLFEEGEQHP